MAPKAALLTAPVVTRTKGLWELTKAELVAEGNARGLWINPDWTVPEIRSMIKEDMDATAAPTGNKLPPGISKMDLAELTTTAHQLNIEVPPKATKGVLMRLIRDNSSGGSQSVLAFGRYRNYLFSETPVGYRRWAIQETSTNANSSEELRHYANWCKAHMEVADQPTKYVSPDDAELNAQTPYVPEESEGTSWELMSRLVPRNAYPTTTTAKATPKQKGGHRRRLPESAAPSERSLRDMEEELDPDVLDEIQHLETRLAVIRDRHGLSRSSAGEAHRGEN